MKTKTAMTGNKTEKNIHRLVALPKSEKGRPEPGIKKIRKTRNINIRICEEDLEMLRYRSAREGIPYQTLISSVLHKYVNDTLVDEEDIRKTMKLLGRRDR
jgi:hypothetical protein